MATPIQHPARPGMELVRAGVALSPEMIRQLHRFEISQLWIEAGDTGELDATALQQLTGPQRQVYDKLRGDLKAAAGRSVTAANMRDYRVAMMDMVCAAVSAREYAGMSYRLATAEGELFAHSANVAYLSVVVGLELETYLVRSRPRLPYNEARDVVGLGLAGMLHDVGKTGARALEEATVLTPAGDRPDGYDDHPRRGYEMLVESRVNAAARNAVLTHHRRWDGGGWPDVSTPEPLEGPRLHIFSRIVAAVNVLDNLLRECERSGESAVHALSRFLSDDFDGWFDPVVRWGVARAVPPFGVGTSARLSDGRAVAVATPNRDEPCRPTVRPLGEADDESAASLVDLSLRSDLEIVESVGRPVGGASYRLPPRPSGAEGDAAIAA